MLNQDTIKQIIELLCNSEKSISVVNLPLIFVSNAELSELINKNDLKAREPESHSAKTDQEILDELISNLKDEDPRELLLPYKAALEAGAHVVYLDCNRFNKRYGTKISASSFSNWINGTQGRMYSDDEINHYKSFFNHGFCNVEIAK